MSRIRMSARKSNAPNTHDSQPVIELSLCQVQSLSVVWRAIFWWQEVDPASPIRYTNLSQHAKLPLTVSKGNTEVNLKIVRTIELKQITSMMKVPPSITAAELVLQFATLNKYRDRFGQQACAVERLTDCSR